MGRAEEHTERNTTVALKVSPEQLQQTSLGIRGLIDEFKGALDNYLNQTMANSGQGGWWGPASVANSNTTHEIHQAQANLNARWSALCDNIDRSAASYTSGEDENVQRLGQAAG